MGLQRVGYDWATFTKTDCHPHGGVLKGSNIQLSQHPLGHTVFLCAHLCPSLCDSLDSALQAPLSMESSRHEYWSGLPFPPPGDLPDAGIELTSLVSPALTGRFFTIEPPTKPAFTRSSSKWGTLRTYSATEWDISPVCKKPLDRINISELSCKIECGNI